MSKSVDRWWRLVPELGLLNVGEASGAWSEIGYSRRIGRRPPRLGLVMPEKRAMGGNAWSPAEWGVGFVKSPLQTLAERGHRKVNFL